MLVVYYIEKDLDSWTNLIKEELKNKGIKISFFLKKSDVSAWWWGRICKSEDVVVKNKTLWQLYDAAIEIGLSVPPPTIRRDDSK